MAITYTQATGQVRLLIADVNASALVLSDDQIAGYLARYGVDAAGPVTPRAPISRAAADALDAIATSEALVSKVIQSQDLRTDGAKVADALRKQAASLRGQADRDDELDDTNDDTYFGVAEFSPYPGSGREATEGR